MQACPLIAVAVSNRVNTAEEQVEASRLGASRNRPLTHAYRSQLAA